MKRVFALGLAVVAATAIAFPAAAQVPATPQIANVRFTMDDGVELAADVYTPAGSGPFPCLVELTPYRKELRGSEGASYLPGQGFALVEVDARGTGGSGGEYDIVFSMREQRDTALVIDQLGGHATQTAGLDDLCTDKVGMFGGSYSGIIQYLVASLPPEYYPQHLAVIAPQRAYGDLYRDIVYHGGILIGSFGVIWSGGTTAYYTVPPLDVYTEPGLFAWRDHLTMNDPILKTYLASPYVDADFSSPNEEDGRVRKLYIDSSILPRIANLKVPALHLAGWFDAFTRGQMLTFEKALAEELADPASHGPNYLIVGPWNHSNTHFINPDHGFKQDLGDWYRYWLANGAKPAFMDGSRVRYYLIGTGALNENVAENWRTASSWPIPEVTFQRYYLRSGAALSTDAPSSDGEAGDSYLYDPAAGTGEILSRWDNAASGSIPQPAWDQRTDEPKGLSYTMTFDRDVRVGGTMNLHLHATTMPLDATPLDDSRPAAPLAPNYPDTDFVVKISDVAPDGTATLITQGYLRASHRSLDVSQSEVVGTDVVRAQHFDDSQHVEPVVPGADTTYDIEIWPTAKTFAAGHSLRLDVYSADTPNHLTLVKPVVNTVLHRLGAESYLTLPLLP